MGNVPLKDVLTDIDRLDENNVIYVPARAEPTGESITLSLRPSIPLVCPEGFQALLAVHLIREILQVWSSWRGGRVPTPEQRLHAVLYYWKQDCYYDDDLRS